jgi:hypothetical protein
MVRGRSYVQTGLVSFTANRVPTRAALDLWRSEIITLPVRAAACQDPAWSVATAGALKRCKKAKQERSKRMRHRIWFLVLAFSLVAGNLLGQTSPQSRNPSPGPKVVRVRMGTYAGMCIGWCDDETSIDSKSIVAVNKSPGDPRRYPELKMTTMITKQDWNDVLNSVDATVLSAMNGRIGCPGCVDERVQWVEVEFSDGTKKGIAYNQGTGPRVIADLLTKLGAIASRPRPRRSEGRKPPSGALESLPSAELLEARKK